MGALRQRPPRDRAGWAGLFTGDARVEDLGGFGSRRSGHEVNGRFYDTFIGFAGYHAPSRSDIVSAVLRDLELEVAMDPAVTVFIPPSRYAFHDRYRRVADRHLRAYWELPAMMLFLRTGWGHKTCLQLLASAAGAPRAGRHRRILTGCRAGRRAQEARNVLNARPGQTSPASVSRVITATTLGEDASYRHCRRNWSSCAAGPAGPRVTGADPPSRCRLGRADHRRASCSPTCRGAATDHRFGTFPA